MRTEVRFGSELKKEPGRPRTCEYCGRPNTGTYYEVDASDVRWRKYNQHIYGNGSSGQPCEGSEALVWAQ